jgi:hypothetical protein
MGHYDREGRPISFEEWGRLFEDREYQRVARWERNGILVSTVWLGIDHAFGAGPPVIFETMVFGPHGMSDELDQVRYCTEAEARAGHDVVVARVAAGRPPWPEEGADP